MAGALSLLACMLVLTVYGSKAQMLVRYPWDWSPDEGLALDYARRLIHTPSTLYHRQGVPFPAAYTPLLPILLSPIVAVSDAPLLPSRLLACVWTVVVVASIYALVRRSAPRPLALIGAALALAPMDFSFWYLLVRVDGLMVALWLLAAIWLLPGRLDRGSEQLSWTRAWIGGTLLLAAALAKPTALVHGAPMVLAWFLVDPPGARRLLAALGAGGLFLLLLLQALTSGGFFWVMRLWSVHPAQPGLLVLLVLIFLQSNGVALLFAIAGFWVALRSGSRPTRDGALPLLAGGLLILPLMAKAGAWWNYLLPAYCGAVVLAARWWGAVAGVPGGPSAARSVRIQATGAILGAALAVGLVLGRTFPVPNTEDEATAAAFYRFVGSQRKPILATRPDYAYFVVNQPVEVEGSTFAHLVKSRVPGTEAVLARLRQRAYGLVVVVSYFWPGDRSFEEALVRNYRAVGTCTLGYFYGRTRFVLMSPAGGPDTFRPPPATRCEAFRSAAAYSPS